MKTLIELYDERPIENVVTGEVFRAEKVVYVCDREIAADRKLQSRLKQYFSARGVTAELSFVETDMLSTDAIMKTLNDILSVHEDCVLDVAGGTDAALFACGAVCAGREIPVLTYSRKRNRFYNIRNAEFAQDLPCEMKLTIRDCFLMAGGDMRTGRVDNNVLASYSDLFEGFFRLYIAHRREWVSIVNYIQTVSQPGKNEKTSLSVSGGRTVKAGRGKVTADMAALKDMEKLGLIRQLNEEGDRIRFRFMDMQVRTWLRDIGSVLELYIYKLCLDAGVYDDVRTSVVVDWEGKKQPDGVTNEIDVMASCGIRPVFISCKTCDVKTEALNELAILRDRFGSGIARAAIVSTGGRGKNVMRNRAQELGIEVIELGDLTGGKAKERLRRLATE